MACNCPGKSAQSDTGALMKILFTTPVLEHPAVGGPALRITNSIKALNRISQLHIISRVSADALGGACAENYFKSICHRLIYTPSVDTGRTFFFKLANFRIRTKKLPFKVINLPFWSFNKIYNFAVSFLNQRFMDDVRFIKSYAVKNKINVIWFGYGNISFELMRDLKKALPETKMVCDTDSVWSRFVLRELELEQDPLQVKDITAKGHAKEAEEKSWVKFMDVTTAVSEVDAEYYRSIAPDSTTIKVFSNVIDLEMYKDPPPPPAGFKKPCMYLAGSFGYYHSPMDRAARWVFREIFPLIKKQIPQMHFYIVGKGSESLLKYINDASVTITGRLGTVLPYLCNADVALVPLKFESGTRFKILEAGACGTPIVSTTLGAEGIPVTHGNDILIADTPVEFANAIIKLVQKKSFALSLAQKCKKLVEAKYCVEHLAKEGREIVAYLQRIPAENKCIK